MIQYDMLGSIRFNDKMQEFFCYRFSEEKNFYFAKTDLRIFWVQILHRAVAVGRSDMV